MTKTLKKTALLGATALGLSAGAAFADQVFNDDVIVDGSLCVGIDCVNGESFGFTTIRLKENNLRIEFVDTSTTASFPTTDWELLANESANGGQNKFSIVDKTANRTPFTVEGSAGNNSLYIDSSGAVGFGTATPVVDLHVVSGNTPTLRLAQDGSSGFTPQTFDVAANEANFFIRDATNGSTLPFRIQPGAASNVIYIASDEQVGLNTTAPDAPLHIRAAGAVNLRFEDSTGAVEWENGLAGNDTFKISAVGTAGVQFRFTREGGFIMQPQAAAPSTIVENGMMYYDSTGADALCARINGAWIVVAGTGTCS